MNIETAAQAIARSESTKSWHELDDGVRKSYRADATAAIDAYRTLTDEQWEAQRENVAEKMFMAEYSHYVSPGHVHIPGNLYGFAIQADAAMTALGFRRTGEATS